MKMTSPFFPNSTTDPFEITSPETSTYNCIAWAYGDDSKWYWPADLFYWPENIRKDESIESFIELFEKGGYEETTDAQLEEGFEKIAIYADEYGTPTHAARQLEDGRWTSKLGQNHDVTHTILSMSNGYYGNVIVYMKREKDNGAISR